MNVGTYSIVLTCPRCGSQLDSVTEGRPTENGTDIRAICECPECAARWLLVVKMDATYLPTMGMAARRKQLAGAREAKALINGTTPVARCGTASGYKAHLRKKEPTCDLCKAEIARLKRDQRVKVSA